ncbi:MAG: tRNA (adenosine(37)-N6)-threonylcarbamoyltransferase complex ATPase subunit type 1 TsaE [bacterium]|jgi:tRNA threonylcarbamoyladenosine biosynthesis protein TsaE|nr:tRNA (adenosine(37)-N6)-threonylcarbamoyltransferase complex ATPase subunit type 1 TsaE [Bacillota bacterium]HHW55385.1 tRNA (adenosine(37)-N6)-threonylcarbamoyltransferase complex ATPase subunit type 1 TsaE [Bacillota bacterium]
MKVITNSPAETRRLGEKLGKLLAPGDLIALTGELGAGKTLLVQGIAAGMGIEATVTSPTFLIIKEYPGKIPLYHMDAYRLAGPEELLALGYEEYFFGQGVTVIEWADLVLDLLPPAYLRIDLEHAAGGEGKRCLVFSARGERYGKLLEELKRNVDTGC